MKSTVKDIMTTRIIWVGKHASFRDMAAALHEHRVSAFPVLDETGKVIGARHVQGVVAVRDRLTYPPRERRDSRFDVLANFPID
jgi:CBS-domain-containing membrane protein